MASTLQFTLPALLLAVSACSSDSGVTDDDDDVAPLPPAAVDDAVELVGQVIVSDSVNDSDDAIAAVFQQRRLPVTITELESSTRGELDTCRRPELSPDEVETLLPAIESTLDAGELLTVSSPSGTFATLPRTRVDDLIFYDTDDIGLPAGLPEQLEISIPGAQFPAFDAVQVPRVAPLVVTNSMPLIDAPLSTAMTWIPGAGNDTTVIINWLEVSADGAGGAVTPVLTCIAADDGNFTVPVELQQRPEFSSNPLAVRLSRAGYAFARSADAILVISRSMSAAL